MSLISNLNAIFGACLLWVLPELLYIVFLRMDEAYKKSPCQVRVASNYSRRSRAVNFHQSDCKKPRIWPRDLSHYRPKSKGRRNFKCLFFYQGDGLSKEVWVQHEWKPKLWSRGHRFFFIKNSNIGKILAFIFEGLFWTRNKVGCSFFLWTLGSAF